MAKRTVEELVERIKELDCEELAELILAIEKEFSVSAGRGSYTRQTKEPVLIDPSFTIILTKCGPNKLDVIKYVRSLSGWSLHESKERVENLPQVVCKVSCPDPMWLHGKAQEIVEELAAMGAEADWTYDYGNYID